jgi:mutator protein MutT
MPAYDERLKERVSRNLARFERVAVPLDGRRSAAVAVTIVGDGEGEACFVITRRASGLRRHGDQWALPGGRLDPGETFEQAALREMSEEVGLDIDSGSVLGLLDDYPTRSGFVITPVVVWGPASAELLANPEEVAAAYTVPLADLEAPGVPLLRTIPESDRPVIAVPIPRLGTAIHAPTAAVLFQIREVLLAGRGTRVAHYEQPVFAWR